MKPTDFPLTDARRQGVFFCAVCNEIVRPHERAHAPRLGRREHLTCAALAPLLARQRELLGRAMRLDRGRRALAAWDAVEACTAEIEEFRLRGAR